MSASKATSACTVPRGWEGFAAEKAIMFVNDSREMHILMRINATYNAAKASSSLFFFHTALLRLPMGYRRSHRHRVPGQDSKVTGRQALLGSHVSTR
jgi:hypothetical protein